MRRLVAKCFRSQSTPSPGRKTDKVQSARPSPRTHVYDNLPTPTSIRVLLLAPGNPDDEIYCYLSPCDLDKDWAIDRSVPRPFESTCVATAKAQGNQDGTKRFVLSMDSYIDESTDEGAPDRAAQNSPALPIDNASADVLESTGTAHNRAGQGRSEDSLEKAQGSASTSLEAGKTQGTDSEKQPKEEHEMGDDWWDLLQLAKLSMANGGLENRVRRHPFQRYIALSYVWGSVENPAYITIDGYAKFKVTRNLFNALKCLRQPDQAISLWVDAICINQNDPEEKRIQIGLMQRVYKQAQKVIAYVPQKSEDVKSFNELAEKILQAGAKCRETIERGIEPENTTNTDNVQAEHQEKEDDDSTSGANGSQVKVLPLKPTGTCIEDYELPPEDDPVWFAWRRFFASPYFRRIWILQEFTLATNLHIHNGSSMLSFPTIFLVMDCVRRHSRMLNAQYLGRGENAELSRAAVLGWRGLEMMSMERVFAQEGLHDEATLELLRKTSKLIDKIRYAFDFDATDPRDKIYALLGLVSDAEHFGPLVSYQPADTYSKVYARFAKALIEQGHLVRLLHMACKTPSSLQLPSWVPDWSAPTTASITPSFSLDRRYRAGGDKTSIGGSFVQNQLVLSGQVVSKIAFMTSPVQKYSLNAAIGGRIQDTFEMLMTALNELSSFLKQNPAETLKSFFYCLTMQLETFESLRRDDSKTSDFIKDWNLFGTLFARISEYGKIENHANHKVTFGAFPEEDLAFIQRVMGNLAGRCFCVTSPGKELGLVPERVKINDRLAIVEGAPVPFVLRETKGGSASSGKVYNLVGDAYVLNMMRGELVLDKGHTWHKIVLV